MAQAQYIRALHSLLLVKAEQRKREMQTEAAVSCHNTNTKSLTQGQAGATWLASGAMSKSFSITLLINHFKWLVSAEVVTCAV